MNFIRVGRNGERDDVAFATSPFLICKLTFSSFSKVRASFPELQPIYNLKQKHGDSIIVRASSAGPAGQSSDRSRKIGGHFK